MDSTDYLKIIILILGSQATEIAIKEILPNRTKEALEKDLIKRSNVLIIRTIIMNQSIKDDWPVAMCSSITLIISIVVIIMRINMANPSEFKQKNNKKELD